MSFNYWYESGEIDGRLSYNITPFWSTAEGRALKKKLMKKLRRTLNNPNNDADTKDKALHEYWSAIREKYEVWE